VGKKFIICIFIKYYYGDPTKEEEMEGIQHTWQIGNIHAEF
jgi:hypothetical protein